MSGPGLWMFCGIGTALHGSRDRRPDGSYVATVWFHFLFIPIMPFESYRVIKGPSQTLQIPGVYSRSRTPFIVLEKAPTSVGHVLAVYSIVGLIALGIAGWIWSDAQERERDRRAAARPNGMTAAEVQNAGFEAIRPGKLEGDGIGKEAKPQNEASLQRARSDRDHRIACLLTCAAYDACVGFQVGRFKEGAGCTVFQTVRQVLPDPPDSLGGNLVFSLRKRAGASAN